MQQNTLIKIGSKLINPESIISVDLDFCDDSSERGVAISLANSEYYFFWGDEAEILRQYFLLGSRTRDLNSFFGNASKKGGVKW
jgi:hypothetical protein